MNIKIRCYDIELEESAECEACGERHPNQTTESVEETIINVSFEVEDLMANTEFLEEVRSKLEEELERPVESFQPELLEIEQ